MAGGRRNPMARVLRMGGHRAVLLRRRALCRSGGSEGGAPPARSTDAPAEQSPQPLRQLSPTQQLRDIAPQRRQHDTRHVERRPRRSLHRRPPRDAAPDVHVAAAPGAVQRARRVRHPASTQTRDGLHESGNPKRPREGVSDARESARTQPIGDRTGHGGAGPAEGGGRSGRHAAGGSKFPEVERAVEEALDLLKYDGDVNDSLAEMRKKWGEGISVLHEAQFDEIGVQYACRSHEEGLAAVGQELTCHGYRLYDLDGDDIYLLTLQSDVHAADFEKACRRAGQYCRQLRSSRGMRRAPRPAGSTPGARCPAKRCRGPMTPTTCSTRWPATSAAGGGKATKQRSGREISSPTSARGRFDRSRCAGTGFAA